MAQSKLIILLLLILSCLALSCQNRPDQAIISDHWQYPVKLGSQRAKVHTLLGDALRSAQDLEEYPPSGVSVWYDSGDRVTKLRFFGHAISLYSADSTGIIPTDRLILQDLTPHQDLAAFKLTFGTPIIENAVNAKINRPSRFVWRGDGLVIVGQFLDSARSYQGKQYPKGTLVSFEIFSGL